MNTKGRFQDLLIKSAINRSSRISGIILRVEILNKSILEQIKSSTPESPLSNRGIAGIVLRVKNIGCLYSHQSPFAIHLVHR